MSLKIVHCGDIHIGASFSGMSRTNAEIRRNEVMHTFSEIIEYCKENNADMLLICGDLFDTSFPSVNDVEFVRSRLASLSPIPVYIAAGNHDCICTDSVFENADLFSENVHIFPCYDSFFEIKDKNAVIWGKSYSSKFTAPSFDTISTSKDKINIFCLHGDMQTGSDYNIITKNTLSALSCNYAAFSHIHNGLIFKCGGICCAYSGTPEPHGFDDRNNTGFAVCDISGGKSNIQLISTGKRKYIEISIDLTEYTDNDSIVKYVQSLISTENLYYIKLDGTKNFDVSADYITSELEKNAFYIKVEDLSEEEIDFESLENEMSFIGCFLRELRLLTTSEEDFCRAAKIGFDALNGKKL